MDFEVTYTEEQQRFRREVRAWLEANVPAGITRKTVTPEDSPARYRDLRAPRRKLGDQGGLYPPAPPQYGGGGGVRPAPHNPPGGGGPPPPPPPPRSATRGPP